MKRVSDTDEIGATRTYRSGFDLRCRGCLPPRPFLRDEREPSKTILGHHIHSPLGMGRPLSYKGPQVRFEVLGWWEGDEENAEELPSLEYALT